MTSINFCAAEVSIGARTATAFGINSFAGLLVLVPAREGAEVKSAVTTAEESAAEGSAAVGCGRGWIARTAMSNVPPANPLIKQSFFMQIYNRSKILYFADLLSELNRQPGRAVIPAPAGVLIDQGAWKIHCW